MKLGFISMPLAGHINPMIALARKLQSRGHEITFIGIPDVGPYVLAAGLKVRLLLRRGAACRINRNHSRSCSKAPRYGDNTLDDWWRGQSYVYVGVEASATHTRRNRS